MPVTLVTGGSSGIGAAVARRALDAGHRVIIFDRAEPPEALRRDDVVFHKVDVADPDAIESIAVALERAENLPDGLVTCAGVLQRPLPPDQLTWKEWDLVQDIHVRGAYACCKSFGARMAARGGGAIVTISSVAGLQSSPLHSYGPAKAAIAHLTRTLAMEWGRHGVRVNCVAPGFTKTPALDRGIANRTLTPTQLEAQSALGRLVAPEEIAEAIHFLLSPAASAITGIVLPVDAGNLVATPWAAYSGGE